MEREDRKRNTINRRKFFARGAAATVAASLAPGSILAAGTDKFHPLPESPLPSRALGNTGARVSLLTFGAAGSWEKNSEDVSLRILNDAIDKGVTSINTAHVYGKGRCEELLGKLMPARRKDVLIHDMIYTRDKDQWWGQLETSLKRLNTDYVDTLMIHAWSEEDEKKLEAENGPVELLYKAKEQKLCRWIGLSCHANSAGLLKFIRRHKLDVIIISLNVATQGYTDKEVLLDLGFQDKVLPEAVDRGQGVIAMKVYGAGQIAGKYPGFDHATCLRYVLSLPAASATITIPNFQQLWDNLEMVKNFEPFSKEQMQALREKARSEIKSSFIEFMQGHTDLA